MAHSLGATASVEANEIVGTQCNFAGMPQEFHQETKQELDGSDVDAEHQTDVTNSLPVERNELHEPLDPDGVAWNFWDFIKPSRVLVFGALTMLYGLYGVLGALSSDESADADIWLLLAVHSGVSSGSMLSSAYFCIFYIVKGDRQHWCWVFSGVFSGTAYFLENMTIARQGVPVFAPVVSGIVVLLLLGFYPGKRQKFATQSAAMVYLSVVPLTLARNALPPMLCLTDRVSPLISSCIYPLVVSAYEACYVPLFFRLWGFKSRRDTPDLGLHLQLTLFSALSEALFFGGLIQMVYRYPEAELPRSVAVSILGRCFVGKLMKRSGLWKYAKSCIWPNLMTVQRDLVGRHAHAQYCFGFVFLIALAIAAFWELSFEAYDGRQVSTPYTNVFVWIAFSSYAFMSLLTEICVAALTFVQRRQMVDPDARARSFSETFMAMHCAGMQPYSTTFRGLFGLGRAAERSFENRFREPAATDTCPSVMGLTPRDIVLVMVAMFAFSAGPVAQAQGLIRLQPADCN